MNKREEQVLREFVRTQLGSKQLNEGAAQDAIKKALKLAVDKLEAVINRLKQFGAARDAIMDAVESEEGGSQAISKIESLGEQLEQMSSEVKNASPELKEGTLAHKNYRSSLNRMRLNESRRLINEEAVLAVAFSAVGFFLAAIGGIPLILKGLGKLVGLTRFKKTSEGILKLAEFFHHIEEEFISGVIPNKPIYKVYLKVEEAQNPNRVVNLKVYEADPETPIKGGTGSRSMTFKEFEKSKLKKKYEKYAYAIVLLPWLIFGLTQVHHALHSWFGAFEAAATTEKSIFVGVTAADAAKNAATDIAAAAQALTAAA